MSDVVLDLEVAEKDTSRSCVFDFPDRPVRPTPPIDPTGGPPDEYPYDPTWDLPPLDPPVKKDPDDPRKGPPPDPSSVPSTHWLHVFEVTPDLGLYHYHGERPHEILMYRQIGLSDDGTRIGKLVCLRDVAEIAPTDDMPNLSGDVIKFWDQPRKTDFQTYTPIDTEGDSSTDPAGQHVMVYWFLFRFTYRGTDELTIYVMAISGGYVPEIPEGLDSATIPGTSFWTPLASGEGQIVNGPHAVMVRNTKHTDVGVFVSIS
jgi:hypothetical protein